MPSIFTYLLTNDHQDSKPSSKVNKKDLLKDNLYYFIIKLI